VPVVGSRGRVFASAELASRSNDVNDCPRVSLFVVTTIACTSGDGQDGWATKSRDYPRRCPAISSPRRSTDCASVVRSVRERTPIE